MVANTCLFFLSSSGVMLRFIPSPPVLFFPPPIFITSVTLDIGTRPFSIAQPMLLPDNCLVSLTSNGPPTMRRSELRRMSTGPILIPSKRMVSDAVVGATLTLWMSRVSKAVVSRSGSKWQAAGPRHEEGCLLMQEFRRVLYTLHFRFSVRLSLFPVWKWTRKQSLLAKVQDL